MLFAFGLLSYCDGHEARSGFDVGVGHIYIYIYITCSCIFVTECDQRTFAERFPRERRSALGCS
jgi:hypothetical protein